MIGDEPKIGYVLRYAYLWHDEFARAQEEGEKDRPCVLIVATSRLDAEGRTTVRVLPITHSAPANRDTAVELPAVTKNRLGLDRQSSWVILTEGNTFAWPGPDVRPVPGKHPPTIYYGPLPPALFRQIVTRLVALARERRFREAPRTL
jgi:hypothetical protein